MKKLSYLTATVLTMFLFLSSASAHDLWLLPDSKPKVGKPVVILAKHGMDFPKGTGGLDTTKIPHRILIGPDCKETPLEAAGRLDKWGLLRFEPAMPGIYLAGVETNPRIYKADAEKFNYYLAVDGLTHIYELRWKEKSLDQPARELYIKSPKVIIKVGQEGGGDPSCVLGLPLEIVPQRDPFALQIGDTLSVRVLFRGKPLADANLGWDHPSEGALPIGTVRTNQKGEALIPIARTGLMTIRMIHMTRPKTKDYEWESFFTTLTFEIP